VYTPPNGAENAFPGEIIASATWNSIFTDISNALTQLGQQQIVYNPRIVNSAGTINVGVSDRLIYIEAAVPNIYLPPSATKTNPVTIIGNASGIFSTTNATLTPNGSEKIDGQSANPVLTQDYQSITLLPLSTGGWLVQ
jgi:hypothetical protein